MLYVSLTQLCKKISVLYLHNVLNLSYFYLINVPISPTQSIFFRINYFITYWPPRKKVFWNLWEFLTFLATQHRTYDFCVTHHRTLSTRALFCEDIVRGVFGTRNWRHIPPKAFTAGPLLRRGMCINIFAWDATSYNFSRHERDLLKKDISTTTNLLGKRLHYYATCIYWKIINGK